MFDCGLIRFSLSSLDPAGVLSPSPLRLQDTWITDPIKKEESRLTNISVFDLGKRRCWLGGPGEKEKFTKDPDQTEAGDSTQRQKRDRRSHEMLYSFRVFVSSDIGGRTFYDIPWDMP